MAAFFPAFPFRASAFLGFVVAPPIAISYLEKSNHIQVVPATVKWPLYFAYVGICILLFHLTAPVNPLKGLPQPPTSKSVFGHASRLLFDKPKGDGFLDWTDNVPNSGLIYYDFLPFGLGPALLLTSPEALHEAMITRSYEFEKTIGDRLLLEKFLGRGLIVVEGSEHKMQRKSVTPAFSGKQINDLILPIFWAKSKELADVIANQLHVTSTSDGNDVRTGVVDVNQWASHVTLDIIGLACVGKDFGSIYNADDELCRTYETILAPEDSRGIAILFEILSVVLPNSIALRMPFLKHVREAARARERLRVLCQELLTAKRRDMEAESSKHIDILSVLIRSGQFDDQGLIDQLLTFLAAGHETTAGALTWTLYLLAINTDIQDELRQELRSHFAQSDHDAQVSSLDTLPFLNAVISEQLRLFPAVPTTGRSAAQDTSLLGHPVPKGTIIVTAPWAINRSKIHWGPDAGEFRPQRWLQDSVAGNKRSPISLLTFLHGPRSCIGQAFSRAELRCLIAAMVTRFDMKMENPTEVVEPVGLVTIKPKNGMRLMLKELSVRL